MMRGLRRRRSAWMCAGPLPAPRAFDRRCRSRSRRPAPATPAPARLLRRQRSAQPQDLIAQGPTALRGPAVRGLDPDALWPPCSARATPRSRRSRSTASCALNYITLGRKDEADNAVRGLLVVQPDYQLPANESPRFRDFFKEARAKWEAEGRPGLVKEKPSEKPVALRYGSPSSGETGEGGSSSAPRSKIRTDAYGFGEAVLPHRFARRLHPRRRPRSKATASARRSPGRR